MDWNQAGVVLPPISLLYLLPPLLVPPPTPLAQALRLGRSCSCIGGPGSSKGKGGCGSELRTCVAHISRDILMSLGAWWLLLYLRE
jgi:hypothetical protein